MGGAVKKVTSIFSPPSAPEAPAVPAALAVTAPTTPEQVAVDEEKKRASRASTILTSPLGLPDSADSVKRLLGQ